MMGVMNESVSGLLELVSPVSSSFPPPGAPARGRPRQSKWCLPCSSQGSFYQARQLLASLACPLAVGQRARQARLCSGSAQEAGARQAHACSVAPASADVGRPKQAGRCPPFAAQMAAPASSISPAAAHLALLPLLPRAETTATRRPHGCVEASCCQVVHHTLPGLPDCCFGAACLEELLQLSRITLKSVVMIF